MTATSLRLTAVLVVVAAVALPRPAAAQNAAAEELFQQGKRLMAKGDIAGACEKFEASDRIEPKAGTELNLGRCRQKNGQSATAWAVFKKAIATAKRNGDPRREAEARKHAVDLQPRLLYLTIKVSDEARIDGLGVKRDDTKVDPAEWNQAMPIDPGEYTISAEATGYKPWKTSVVIKTRSATVEIPVLDKLPEVRPEPSPREASRSAGADDAAAVAVEHDAEDTEARPAPSRWTGKRKLSLVLAAVGVAAGGAGVVLGLHASSLEDQSDARCKTTMCSNATGVDLNKSARRYALGANVGFAVGGAAVVGAVALWFLGAPPSRDGVALVPALDHERVGLSLARSF